MLKNVLQICLVCILNGRITSGQKVPSPYGWSTQLLLSHTSVTALRINEPGFDFTNEEMQNLKLWPDGIISYYIDDMSFDKVLRDRIRSYLDIFSGITGVYFMERPNPPLDPKERWVLFVNRRGLLGCADHNVMNFTTEGLQKVVLGYDCIRNSAELGEVALAIVGVPPQHNSPDRDEYITVNMDKVVPGKEYLFKKLDNKEWLFHDVKYDFSSLSHFHYHKHSIDGHATINPKVHVDKTIHVGEGDGLSYTDVLKVRMLYNYIAKKKHLNIKAPECNKILKKKHGAKLPKNADEPEVGEPRPKPNKYLGLPDNDIENEKKEYDYNQTHPAGNINQKTEDGSENDSDQVIQDASQNNIKALKNYKSKFAMHPKKNMYLKKDRIILSSSSKSPRFIMPSEITSKSTLSDVEQISGIHK